jgi:hypothetical protein
MVIAFLTTQIDFLFSYGFGNGDGKAAITPGVFEINGFEI